MVRSGDHRQSSTSVGGNRRAGRSRWASVPLAMGRPKSPNCIRGGGVVRGSFLKYLKGYRSSANTPRHNEPSGRQLYIGMEYHHLDQRMGGDWRMGKGGLSARNKDDDIKISVV